MDIQREEISSPEEYVDFVRKFVTLLDKQLTIWEERAQNKAYLYELARHMPALICLVNTVGYLRGQDGMFLDIRPLIGVDQRELYKYEDLFEKRLNRLIDILMDSDVKDYYKERLESYFVKVRTKQKPSVV
jgi:hypothetical protein